MKFVQENKNSSRTSRKITWISRFSQRALPSGENKKISFGLKYLWNKWYIQAVIFLLAFILGAFVYRSGVFRPVIQAVQNLFNSGVSSAFIPEPVQEIIDNVKNEARLYMDNGLPTMYMDISFEDYQQLLQKRNEALEIGILNTTDADFVDAIVHLQGENDFEANVRLKGDWTDHLVGDKWSFRIKIKDDGQILGMEQFSIQTPAARNFLNEWAFHQNLLQEGVLTTRYQFVNVLLNGKLLGIYAIEDHFTAELIESQGRRQGLILRFNEDPMWQNMSAFWAENLNHDNTLSVTNSWTASIDAFQEAKLAEDPILSSEAETARNLLKAFQAGERSIPEIFDVELWGRFFALHDLWSAPHGVVWHNLRFYYNPITALVAPGAFDSEPFYRRSTKTSISSEFIGIEIFNDPLVRTAYAKELFRMTDPEYITKLVENFTTEHDQLSNALNVEFPLDTPIPDSSVVVDWNAFSERAKSLHLELTPEVVATGSFQIVNNSTDSTKDTNLILDLVNIMMVPIDLTQVEYGDHTLLNDSGIIKLPPVIDIGKQGVETTRINLPLDSNIFNDTDEISKVVATFQITGLDKEFKAELSGAIMPEVMKTGPVPSLPSIDQVLKDHPFLQKNEGEPLKLIVSPGIWDVKGDLILPSKTDLFIPAGTVLRFEEESIIYATGGLMILGTSSDPVLLTAQNDFWGGIVVLNSNVTSEWQYSVIEKTSGINRDGWVMTGGITFFKSNINLDNVVIGNNQGEDAINVVHSNYSFKNSEFLNTFADAFDGDFSDGEITGCYFHDIAGDAIDISGSDLTVSNTQIINVLDKGFSVGEKSTITVKDVTLDTIGIGLASKDLSTAIISNSQIKNVRFAALAAYIKKPVFGPASIQADFLIIENAKFQVLVQNGSTVILDGKLIDTIDMDVELLYEQGVLGN